MDNPPQYESPRIKIISTRLGPSVELARWLLERAAIPYEEEVHAPAFHAIRSYRYGVGVELPVMVWPEKPTAGIFALLDGLDERGRSGDRLYGEGTEERAATRQLVQILYEKLFHQAVNLYYFYMLPNRSAVIGPAVQGAPLWERACVRAFYPLWRRLMRKGLKLNAFDPAAGIVSINAVFDQVAQMVSPARPFLAGAAPGTADIVFAALASPIILPANLAAKVPALDALPAELKAIVTKFREHPAGRLVDAIYATRPAPQPALRAQRNKFSLGSFFGRPRVLRIGGWLLRTFAPRLKFGSKLIVSRWADVCEVLERDADFLIGPINAARINLVSGPFILGMDRSPELTQQLDTVYAALSQVDMAPVRAVIDTEPGRVLEMFAARYGRIDVVNSYARIVAARTAVALFGIRGPTEQDLLRVCRAVFQETFLNLNGDAAVTARGAAAGRELAEWVHAEIVARKTSGALGGDMLGRLLALQQQQGFMPESVPWMLSGFLVGAIDTTATVTANIIQEVVADRRLKENMVRDLNDPARFLGWCWEALRRRPHNPILLRQAAAGVEFHGKTLTADTQVIAFTLAAMFDPDPAAFAHPATLDPTRPLDRYLHFGRGVHLCGGRTINVIQVPALVRELVRFGVTRHSGVQMQGPFPDVLVVGLKGVAAK
jgi:cytochrome P450